MKCLTEGSISTEAFGASLKKHHKGEMMNPVASFGHTSLTDGQLTVFILICYYSVVNGGG